MVPVVILALAGGEWSSSLSSYFTCWKEPH